MHYPIGMNPKAIELQARTNRFATAVINFCERLPKNDVTGEIVPQLIDSSGSTDSNYRATCRARSDAEFIAKIGIALEEADESKGWLELLVSSNQVSIDEAAPLIKEANELVSIFVTSHKTAKRNKAERDRLAKEARRVKSRRT